MPGKPKYERKTTRLGEIDVSAAIAYAEGDAISGRIVEWLDQKTTGLTLRITPGRVVWYVRRREITIRLGLASDIALEDARYYAEQIRLAAGRHRDLRAYAHALLSYSTPDPHMVRDAKSDQEREGIYIYAMAERERAKTLPAAPTTPFLDVEDIDGEVSQVPDAYSLLLNT